MLYTILEKSQKSIFTFQSAGVYPCVFQHLGKHSVRLLLHNVQGIVCRTDILLLDVAARHGGGKRPEGCSSVVMLSRSTRSSSYFAPCRRAIGVMVLWDSPSVSAKMNADSSVYPRHAIKILSTRSMSCSGVWDVMRTTDMGHFTMPASTSSKPGKVKGVSTGAFSMAKV